MPPPGAPTMHDPTGTTPGHVLRFWFAQGDAACPDWFAAGPSFDQRVAETLGAASDPAVSGGLVRAQDEAGQRGRGTVAEDRSAVAARPVG